MKPQIGLDIGTSAVRAAEVRGHDPATLVRFAQLSLPAGAVVAGEVIDEEGVAAVIKDLWKRAGFKVKRVALAVANPSVVVRQVDLPAMSDEDLRGALPYQVQDYIPIAVDDALLDFVPLSEYVADDGAAMQRVLAVAAQKEMVSAFVRVVERAGLDPVAVDLGPLAAVRALCAPAPPVLGEIPSEVVVDIGAGVSTVIVHRGGDTLFVRILGSGGLDITAALVEELAIQPEEAEALKQSIGLTGGSEGQDARVADIIRLRARMFIEDIRQSLDFYHSQPDAQRISRVILTGGGSRLRGLAEQLGEALRAPVEPADAFAYLTIGDIGLDATQIAHAARVGAVAVGLALEER